jgi:hypothetical protein
MLVARQFPGHRHSMLARGLHAVELFSHLVISEAEAVLIGQSKEISRHGLGQRPPGDSRSVGLVSKLANESAFGGG